MSDIATKLTTIAENQQRVYDAGYTAGQSAGGDTDAAYQQGVTDGKQAEYDAFWDVFQDNGARTNYQQYGFAGYGFNMTNFFPKYDIRPTNVCQYLFYSWGAEGHSGSLAERLAQCNVVLDTSKVTSFNRSFAWCRRLDDIPPIDLTGITNGIDYCFYEFNGTTIQKLIVKEDLAYTNVFLNARNLTNITFEGTIGQSINFQWSPLSKASIENIIEHLSSTASGMTLTLNKTAVGNAFGSTTADEWTALISTKSNWTINLA